MEQHLGRVIYPTAGDDDDDGAPAAAASAAAAARGVGPATGSGGGGSKAARRKAKAKERKQKRKSGDSGGGGAAPKREKVSSAESGGGGAASSAAAPSNAASSLPNVPPAITAGLVADGRDGTALHCVLATTSGAPPSQLGLLDTKGTQDTAEVARRLFAWLIYPMPVAEFYEQCWERRPLLVQRHAIAPGYSDGWFSKADVDTMLRSKAVDYTEDVDVTKYVDGRRVTLNPEGRAEAASVWNYFEQQGCSVRLKRPQAHSKRLWQLLSWLEEEWGQGTSSNTYLTPAGTQGFAPHYDDVDAFIVQLEGQKRWRVYAPRTADETLPRYSSPNFSQEEIGEPVLDVLLRPGDMLYFPRGWIHQGVAPTAQEENASIASYSHHLTVSTGLRGLHWGDFLSQALQQGAALAMESNVELRRSLPTWGRQSVHRSMGVLHSDAEPESVIAERRAVFERQALELAKGILQHMPLDMAADQMAKQWMHDRLPLALGAGQSKASYQGDSVTQRPLTEASRVRLAYRGAARLVVEESADTDGTMAVLYHCVDNDRWYHGKDPQSLLFSLEYAPAIEHILKAYPAWCVVGDLPEIDAEEAVELAGVLFQMKLVITDLPAKSRK